jgi:ARG/rhodanese/phosphatase superfamily protein
MERTVWGAIIGGLLGLSTIGAIGFVGGSADACGGPPVPRAKIEGDWRLLDPITFENITIFPVVSNSSHDTGNFLTLEDGLSNGEVIVREQGSEGLARSRDNRQVPQNYSSGPSVNQLMLINRSKRPLLLLAGELVSGGKQDRIIAKDRIIAPGAEPLPLDVFCVEHGRWSSGTQFSAANTIVHPSVREQAALNLDQNQVWDAVRSGSKARRADAATMPAPAAPPRISAYTVETEIASGAPTQSYAKIYKESRIGGSVDTFVEEVQRRFAKATRGLKSEQVVGVVVAYGGEVAWSDIFASGDLFDHYWSKLLRSYAVEAMARPTFRETADRDDAREFLRRLNGRERQESEPGVYIWREITEGRLSQIELDALQPKPVTLHRLVIHRTS